MHAHPLNSLQHSHVFDRGNPLGEINAKWVAVLTLIMMVVEITAGWWFNSMALLADGWHMSSHAVALGLVAFAYASSRRYANDKRFAFGSWKIEILSSYTSALILLGVAVMMIISSFERLWSPQTIHYPEAMLVAVIGLLVNAGCALLLTESHHHTHHDDHNHHHAHSHFHEKHSEDLNLKSAYVHVMTDALTSILAIFALAGGWYFGWNWLDPIMGIVGAILIIFWARGLLQSTVKILLDREMDQPVVEDIRHLLKQHFSSPTTQLTDLHVWRVSKDSFSVALSLFTHDPQLQTEHVRQVLATKQSLAHSTIEIVHCPEANQTSEPSSIEDGDGF